MGKAEEYAGSLVIHVFAPVAIETIGWLAHVHWFSRMNWEGEFATTLEKFCYISIFLEIFCYYSEKKESLPLS